VGTARPFGITLVSIWTVITALGTLLFGLILYTLAIGEVNPNNLFVFGGFVSVVVIVLLIDAVLVFRGVKAGYFLSMAMWTLVFCLGVLQTYWSSGYGLSAFSLPSNPYFDYAALYTIVCFVYFLRKNVRAFFGL
jgi:hypothetical protein